MHFRAIIPFRPANPKTRLSGVLTEDERKSFAHAMLTDVISVLHDCGSDVTLLSTEPYICPEAAVVTRNEGLNEALNWILPQCDEPVLIVMSDLPLITKETILKVCSSAADLAIVPGLGGGTNILFIRDPKQYHVQYYGYSYRQHVEIAESLGMTVESIDSMRMSTDVDEPADLVELLIHGTGNAKEWLIRHEFTLSAESGRVKIKRRGIDVI
ncbi:MAG TPA: 2-phospho-L-lactate guanylyltransferase [Methanocorpusculum sp.]|nr:2-phospho-L-lactate guanylyltransferase [Methanocorpusculum sp.]